MINNIHSGFIASSITKNSSDSSKNSLNEMRLNSLKSSIFPLTDPVRDTDGQTIQLWSIPGPKVTATLKTTEGNIRFIYHIKNGLNPEDDSIAIHNRLLSAPLSCQWRFATAHGCVIVWPYLSASGWKEAIPKSHNDLTGLTRLARGRTQEQMCSWMYSNGYEASSKEEARIEMSMEGQSAGNYSVSDRQTISNLLRQGATITQVNFPPPPKGSKEIFIGRGILFKHPNDRSQTTFNIDFTVEKNESSGEWGREEEGGYHIDIKSGLFGSKGKIRISTKETYDANYEARKEGKNNPYNLKASMIDQNPAVKQFNEKLQKTGLTDSYNATNPDDAVSKEGGEGEIGGVGCTVEYIKELFDSPESLFDTEHAFFVPSATGEPLPFSAQELHQILYELAIGIYIHNTVPFFSLHFNQKSQLYPVIHPAYEKTLVGQVFSMLDYFMKGYLNGGVFKEDFVYRWANRPVKIKSDDATLKGLVNFKAYAQRMLQGEDAEYISLRQMIKNIEMDAVDRLAERADEAFQGAINCHPTANDTLFRDYTHFTNSSRIIARQTRIEKAGNLFVLKGDFDAYYTIEPTPEYRLAMEQYYKVNGNYPTGYEALVQSYKLFMTKIHDHMVKLPMCQKYFAMLNVISFFSSYFVTLKKHHKYPILPKVEGTVRECPPLFPSLPLLSTRKEQLKLNLKKITEAVLNAHSKEIIELLQADKIPSAQLKQKIKATIKSEIWNQFYNHVSPPMQREMKNERPQFEQLCQTIASKMDILKIIIDQFSETEKRIIKQVEMTTYELNKPSLIQQFVNVQVGTLYPDEAKNIMEINKNQFILPSEQTADEIRKCMTVVGGCCMKMQPQSVESSITGEVILEDVGMEILNQPPGNWIAIEEGGDVPKGAVFSLLFADIPLEAIHNPLNMESLLTQSTGKLTAEIKLMNQILNQMSNGNWNDFTSLISTNTISHLKDRQGRTLLHHAVQLKDIRYTEKLLQMKCSAVEKDNLGYTPLHYAAAAGSVRQLEMLLSAPKAHLEAKNNQGATPLITAIQNKREGVVNLLLDRGAMGNVRLIDGYTVLHCAAHQGDLAILEAILNKSTEAHTMVNEVTQEGITPLMLAAEKNITLVEKLIKMGGNPHIKAKNGTTVLDRAVTKNDLALCQILIAICPFSPFTVEKAIKTCSLEINILLATKKEYAQYRNTIGDTPLIMALRYANVPLALHILDHIPAPASIYLKTKNQLEETAVDLSARGGMLVILEKLIGLGAVLDRKSLSKLLLKHGYSGDNRTINQYLNQEGWTQTELKDLLLTAAEAGNHAAIGSYLLPLGVNLDALQTTQGWRIEHYLARSDGIFLIRQRLAGTVDFLRRVSPGGKTLPYIAGENGSLRVLSFLLDNLIKRNIALHSHYETRHLLWSVLETGNVKGVELFLTKLKDPELLNHPLDDKGRTAAHVAAMYGSLPMLKYLRSKGITFLNVDLEGCSPLSYAVDRFKVEAVSYILENITASDVSPHSIISAASHQIDRLFQLLIKWGVNLNVSDGEGNSPLMIAVKNNDLTAFPRLLEKGVSLTKLNEAGWSAFLLACKNGQAKMAAALLSRLPPEERKIKHKGNNALHIASFHGHGDCIRLLINHGFDPTEKNENEKNAIDLANNMDARAAFGIHPYHQHYENMKLEIQNAIFKQDISKILKQIDQWPSDVYFEVYIPLKGMTFKGTLLHLLMKGCSSSPELKNLIKQVHDKNEFLPQLKDQNGMSYAHLVVESGIDLSGFTKFNYEEQGPGGTTPLHLAAKIISITPLKQLIQYLGMQKLNPIDHLGCTPLYYAIINDNKEHLQLLIDAGADLNCLNSEGMTPLGAACYSGNEPFVRLLIKHGALVNANSHSTKSPLSIAIRRKKEEIALYLLSCGADAQITNENGIPMVHLAAKGGLNSVINSLFVKGISINSLDHLGMRPIHYAAIGGKTQTVALLESLGVDINIKTISSSKEGFQEIQPLLSSIEITPLHLAVMEGTIETVKWLIDKKSDFGNTISKGETLLAYPIFNQPNVSRQLLKLFDNYPLSENLSQLQETMKMAIARDRVDVLQYIFDKGLSIDGEIENGKTPLHLVCQKGAIGCTAFLLAKGADPFRLSSNGEIPIQFAAANSSVEQFALMLKETKQELNRKYQRGETLLHIAIQSNKISHTCLLIDCGADVDIRNDQGQTPLFIAAQQGCPILVELLMIWKANPNIGDSFSKQLPESVATPEIAALIKHYREKWVKSPKGRSPLHMAVRSTHSLAIKLAARRFDLDEQDHQGITPLHIAANQGNIFAIHVLLSEGADLSIKSHKGWTPLAYACLNAKNVKIAQLLCQRGANPDGLEANNKSLKQYVKEKEWGAPFITLFDKFTLEGK